MSAVSSVCTHHCHNESSNLRPEGRSKPGPGRQRGTDGTAGWKRGALRQQGVWAALGGRWENNAAMHRALEANVVGKGPKEGKAHALLSFISLVSWNHRWHERNFRKLDSTASQTGIQRPSLVPGHLSVDDPDVAKVLEQRSGISTAVICNETFDQG